MIKLWARPWRLNLRYLAGACLVALCLAYLALRQDQVQSWTVPTLHSSMGLGPKHVIQKLMAEAEARCRLLMSRRSLDVASAAARYRERRGRHPPPGFDGWFKAARDADAVVVEDFFDRIYHDLTPFWALDPNTTRVRAQASPFVVRVRRGKAVGVGDVEGHVPWLQLWTALVDEFARHLPDVDMPINMLDEPRILVPFDDMAKLVDRANREKSRARVADVTSEYGGLGHVDDSKPQAYEPQWHGPSSSYWNLAVKTCGPHTPAFAVDQVDDLSPPAAIPHDWGSDYTLGGYVRNWTAAMDPCLQPHIRQLHGTFIEPLSLSSTEELIPLFGGSKLPMNNEILIPGAMYLTEDAVYSGGKFLGPPWHRKKDRLVWRGAASGGRTREHTWHHFQRQRLVDMLNGTTVSRVEVSDIRAPTFELSSHADPRGWRQNHDKLGPWIQEFADAGFVHLCPPNECDFLGPQYRILEQMPMEKQFEYKFLPDVDGNSFSARFRGFLRSTSLPLKATIYAEWHDDRLVPWAHFVPLDNTFRDLYRVLDFFADGAGGRGDAAAASIAKSGRLWAERVLRREDMRLYVWRLLLEWARVCDENRHRLGFVGDLAP